MRGRVLLTLVLLAVASVLARSPACGAAPTPEQLAFFESKVRPLLVEHCYECHSTEAGENEAGLVLDSKWGWRTGGDSGPAIVPGDLEGSLLIDAVRYDEDIVSGMPPRSKLPDKQIAILERWVEMGAPDPRSKVAHAEHVVDAGFDLQQRIEQHWSWRPAASVRPPEVRDASWPRSDIDRFVLARIEAAGLRPAKPADKRTWLRRVYFDLIGLPPTCDQIADFLADDSAEAYEHVVSGLLDSPHFGEKWARHWMDLVRYAETYGHEFDYPIRHAHQYRDYLIRALNCDLPYDQFVREHIAGDLMPEPRRHPSEGFNESIIGTGFWYLHEATHAPTDVLGNEADIIDNQLDVFGKAFLGLTVACARCHDHKFDAISMADYYALSAYLQSSCRQESPLDPGRTIEQSTEEINRLRQQAARQLGNMPRATQTRLHPGVYFDAATQLHERASGDNHHADVPQTWIVESASKHGLDKRRLGQWVRNLEDLARLISKESTGESTLLASFDAGRLPDGWSTSGFAFQPVGAEAALSVDGRLAAAGSIDSGLAGKKQVGILRSPTFEISTKQIHVRMKATAGITMRVIIDNYQMTQFNALLFKGTLLSGKSTDTDGRWVWKSFAGDLKKYIGHKAYLEFIDADQAALAIDEVRFADRLGAKVDHVSADAATIDRLWREGLEELRNGRTSRFIGWMLDCGLLDLDDLSPHAAGLLRRASELAENLPAPRFVVAMAQGTPEPARVYIRGSHANLGQEVPARFLDALGGQHATRLQLADLVASSGNPLTARVLVNRLWHHLLGRGIVATVDDFGPQGQPPSHPALLDWLADDFVANGWSLKHTIGQIVLSQTYRQSSVAHVDIDPERIAAADPTNALLHRMRVRRLPAESIRDAILLVSGRLDAAQFGPSVSTHRTEFMTGRGARVSGPIDGDGRRSIYLSVYRNFLNPFLLAFDMPSPFGPNGRRSQSNVPAQALTLMNDPFVIQQAEIWAERILAQQGLTDQQRITRMVEQSLGVVPTAAETKAFESFLARQAEIYAATDNRSWADLGHALLNIKAFYFLK